MHYKAHTVKAAAETLDDLRAALRAAEVEIEGVRRLTETMPEGVNGKSFADQLPGLEAARDKAAANVEKAAADLMEVKARTMQDVLRKVAALGDDMPEGAGQTLAQEATGVLEQEDPVIDLATRLLRLRKFINTAPNAQQHGWMPADPRHDAAMDELIALERQLENMPPRTPEGLALMLDVKWGESLDVQPGSDLWEALMDNPETRFLASIRYGAHVLAGRKADID